MLRTHRTRKQSGTKFTILDISTVWFIATENGIDDAVTFCVCHKVTTVTDETTGRNFEFQTV